MESFAPILGMSMMVFGLVMLVVSFCLLTYAVWLRYKVEPSQRQSKSVAVPDSYSGAERQ